MSAYVFTSDLVHPIVCFAVQSIEAQTKANELQQCIQSKPIKPQFFIQSSKTIKSSMKLESKRTVLGFAFIVLFATVLVASNTNSSVKRSLLERLNSASDRRALQAYDISTAVPLPSYANMFADVWAPIKPTDTAFFFYVAKAGGLTFQKICAECLGLTSASSRGDATGSSLEVRIRAADHGKYVNVNLGTREGIARAKVLGLASSGMVDIAFSAHLAYSTQLFSTTHMGRGIVMFRNPVKRLIDQFYYQQRSAWLGPDKYDEKLGAMSLLQFSKSSKLVENFMVRSLAHLPDEMDITEEHIDIAKEVLRRKFIVGVMEWFDLSITRFERFFGWWDSSHVWDDRTVNYCHYNKLITGDHIGRCKFNVP
jgi:hypothetical protein